MTKLTPRNRDGWTQVHVSFSINNLETKVTEEILRGIFEKYGEIADVTVKKHMCNTDSGMQSGYGFVYYLNGDNAVTVVQEMKSMVVDTVTYDCSLSYKSELLLSGGSNSSVAVSSSTWSTATDSTVPVTNFPPSQRGKASTPRAAGGVTSTASSTTSLNAAASPSMVNIGNVASNAAFVGQNHHSLNGGSNTSSPSFNFIGESVSKSPAIMSNPEVSTSSLSRNFSSGKVTDNVSKSGIPRPPPLVTQFSQARMVVQQNIRVNAPSSMETIENTPTSSPSYFMHPQHQVYGMVGAGMMIPQNSYPVSYFNSENSTVTSSHHISPSHHLQQQQQQQLQHSPCRSSPSNGSQPLYQHPSAPLATNPSGVTAGYVQQSSPTAFVASYPVTSMPSSANYVSSHHSYAGSNSIHMTHPGQSNVPIYLPPVVHPHPHSVSYYNPTGAGGYVARASPSSSPSHLQQQNIPLQHSQPLAPQCAPQYSTSLPIYAAHRMATMPVSHSPAAAIQTSPVASPQHQHQHQQQILYRSMPPVVVDVSSMEPSISTASTPTDTYMPQQYMMVSTTHSSYSAYPGQHLSTGTPVYGMINSFPSDSHPQQQHLQYSVN